MQITKVGKASKIYSFFKDNVSPKIFKEIKKLGASSPSLVTIKGREYLSIMVNNQ